MIDTARNVVVCLPMPWRPKLDAKKLKKQNDELALQLLRTREQLQQKEGYLVGMEVLLDQRAERIDRLTVQVNKLLAQNRRLDQENEHLAEMIRFGPQLDAQRA